MADGSSSSRNAITSDALIDGVEVDGLGSRPTSTPMQRLRHRTGKAITDPTAPGPLRGSLSRSPEKNSVPCRITQLAADHNDGPRLGTRPVSASTFTWPFGS